MEILSKSLKETEETARVFLEKLLPRNNQATVVALFGDLGSGKTTFAQSTAGILGICDRITSPTFVIMKKYLISNVKYRNFIHIDAYRLKRGEELEKLGFAEILADSKNLIFIEWPENIADAIPQTALKVFFEFIDEKTRKITFVTNADFLSQPRNGAAGY